jgi:hypothetical protein
VEASHLTESVKIENWNRRNERSLTIQKIALTDGARGREYEIAFDSWDANSVTRGRFFVHFLPRKITFRGKFRGICLKNDFSKLFPRKIQFFPNNFWGKFSAKFSAEFSPDKNVRKIGPRLGEFSPVWAVVHFGQLLKNYKICANYCHLFSCGTSCVLIWTKNGLGYILGDYLASSSGHPGCEHVI